jgi:hypothetical protein
LPLLLLLAATEEALPTACFKERHPAPLWKLLQLLCTLFGAATSGQDVALTEELHWRRLPSIDAATNRVPCQHTHTQKRNPHQLSLSLSIYNCKNHKSATTMKTQPKHIIHNPRNAFS